MNDNYTIVSLINNKVVKDIINFFERDSKELRLVGGCVRDAFLGRKTKDIDLAANAKPNEIIEILKKNKIKYELYGYKYGSVTAFIKNKKIQITSLRKDINQRGRDTNVIFTSDWKKDASRRDFTINSIYLSAEGKIYDYFNGQNDLYENKIKFIGKVQNRLEEDYLRIFRYYRFLGIFDIPKFSKQYERIIEINNLQAYNFLSNDIIRQEILKMFNMPFPLNCFYKKIKGNEKEKREWLKNTIIQFKKNNYKLGLNKCLNKLDLLK